MEIVFNLNFKRTYNIEVVTELGSEEQYSYPSGAKDGLMVRVIPSSGCEPWIGIFAFGEVTPNGMLAIYSLPDSDKFCVVSRGAGYIVSSSSPKKWEGVKAIPIVGVRCVESHNIIVFADYTELIAYNESGIKWRTQRLAYDSFEIIDIENNVLRGKFWDIRNEVDAIFEVSLDDGSQTGGIGEFN